MARFPAVTSGQGKQDWSEVGAGFITHSTRQRDNDHSDRKSHRLIYFIRIVDLMLHLFICLYLFEKAADVFSVHMSLFGVWLWEVAEDNAVVVRLGSLSLSRENRRVLKCMNRLSDYCAFTKQNMDRKAFIAFNAFSIVIVCLYFIQRQYTDS